jgi:polyphenol oxidase
MDFAAAVVVGCRVGTDLSDATVVNAPLGGSMENSPHNAIHLWVGDHRQRLNEDMGTFTTAARDPIFFAHHANIDRLWAEWEKLPGGRRRPPLDPDFLEAEFPFFDEHANLVKVKVRDALDSARLGVAYPNVPTDDLWKSFEPLPVSKGSAVPYAKHRYGLADIGVPAAIGQPSHQRRRRHDSEGTIALGDKLVVLVARPRPSNVSRSGNVSSSSNVSRSGNVSNLGNVSRSGNISRSGNVSQSPAVHYHDDDHDDHDDKVEVLVLDGLHFKRRKFVQLSVFLNLPDADASTPATSAEFVGSFSAMPDPVRPHHRVFVAAKFAIDDNVRRLGLANDTELVVTVLVQPHGAGVKMRRIEIIRV